MRPAVPLFVVDDVRAKVLHEGGVVRNGNHSGVCERGKVINQPLHGLGVEVVRGLIEEEDVRLGDDSLEQTKLWGWGRESCWMHAK